jgi:phage tail-like protein
MAAPLFPVNAHRYDPYRTFKFRVIIDGQTVAGLSKMSKLEKSTEVVDWRTAGDPSHVRKLPGGTKYEPITLEQGLTHDHGFEEWANLVNNFDGDGGMSLKNYRRNLVLQVLNLQGTAVLAYKVFRAWVSQYQALPDFDSKTMNTVGIQSIRIEHEGWQRDTAVAEPAET